MQSVEERATDGRKTRIYKIWFVCIMACAMLSPMVTTARADTPDEQFEFATGLYSQKLWSLAAENLRKFVEANPNDPHAKIAAYQLGAALYRATNGKGDVDYAAAAAAYERAIANYPDPKLSAAARYELGDAYFNLKKYEKSAATYAEFLKSNPPAAEAAEAQYSIAESYYALNKKAEAKQAYEKLLAQYGTSRPAPYAQLSLGLLAEEENQYGAAATAYKTLLARYPKTDVLSEARLRLANVLLPLKRYDEARDAYRALLADPAAAKWKSDAQLGLADALFGVAQREQVAGRGAEKNWSEAATAYTQTLASLPADDERRAIIQMRLADSYYNAKDYTNALANYTPLASGANAKIAPNALYFSANTLRALKRFDEAAAQYRKFLAAYPQHEKAPRAALNMGDSYADAKDAARAAEAYKMVLTKYGTSDAAKEARDALSDLVGEVTGSEAGGAQTEAVEEVLRTLPAGPAASNAQLRLAQAAFGRSDWAKAAQLAQAALAGKPDKATQENALYLIASSKLRAGTAVPAADAFRRQLAVYPQGALANQGRLGLTWALLDAKQWSAAESAARAALNGLAKPGQIKDKTDLQNWAKLALGEALLRGGKAKEAAITFAALESSPAKDVAAQGAYGAALAFEAQKQWASAAAHWGKYAGLSSDAATQARAYWKQGLALSKANSRTAALAAFDRATAKDPKGEIGAQALYESAWLAHDLKQGAQEAARWQRLATEFPDSKYAAEATLQQAEALFAAKSWNEAAAVYRQIIERYPKSESVPLAWYQLGSAVYQAKNWSEAAPAFDKAATFPKSADALESSFWAGESWRQAGNLNEARTRYETFVKGASTPTASKEVKALLPAARLGLGQALAAAGDWARAATVYEAGLAGGARGAVAAELSFRLGEALAQQNKHKEAATQFLKVATLYRDSEWASRAQWSAAEATEKSGDKQAAIELYRALATRQPANELTAKAQERLTILGASAAG